MTIVTNTWDLKPGGFFLRPMRRQATNESCGGGEGCQEGREEPRPIYKLIGTHL